MEEKFLKDNNNPGLSKLGVSALLDSGIKQGDFIEDWISKFEL